MPVVSAMFYEPLCAHRPEFRLVDTPPPRCEEENGQHTDTEQQSNPERHGSSSNLTYRAGRFGVAVRFAAVHASRAPFPGTLVHQAGS